MKITVPETIILLRLPDVLKRRGVKRSRHYKDIKDGLYTPPVKNGANTSTWPDYEDAQISRLLVAGAGKDEQRQLVRELVAARKLPSSPDTSA